MKTLLPAFLILFLLACGGGSEPSSVDDNDATGTIDDSNTGDESNDSTAVTLSFIHMNDLHANLLPHNEAFRIEGSSNMDIEVAGGITRMASKIKSIRQENPDNTLLMNIGDTFHGGAEAMFTNGNAIVEAVNELDIDIGVIGNWDYAYGPIITNARFGNLVHEDVSRPNYPLLAANATYRIPPALANNPAAASIVQNAFNYTDGEAFLPGTQIIEKSGIKIGFIGLTSDIVEFMHPIMAFNIAFTQGKDEYLSLLQTGSEQLKEQGAELIVVMSELGLQKDWALAKELGIGEIDIIFSAHTHELTENVLVADNGTRVVESGNDSYLGQMDITIENGEIIDSNWILHRLDSSVEEDPEMLSLVNQIREPFLVETPNIKAPTVSLASNLVNDIFPKPVSPTLRYGLNQVIASSTLPLNRRHSLENDFNGWFTDRLREGQLTDVTMISGFRFDSVIIPSIENFSGEPEDYSWQSETPEILNGEIKVSDAYRFFPSPFNIAKGNISIGQLKNIIESNLQSVYSTDIFAQKGGWMDGFSGLELVVDLTKLDGQRVQSITVTGLDTVPDDSFMISVAGCARPFDQEAETTLCAYQGFSEVENLIDPITGEAYTAADYLLDLLQNGDLGESGTRDSDSFNDLSETPQWPISPYFQPLEGAISLDKLMD